MVKLSMVFINSNNKQFQPIMSRSVTLNKQENHVTFQEPVQQSVQQSVQKSVPLSSNMNRRMVQNDFCRNMILRVHNSKPGCSSCGKG